MKTEVNSFFLSHGQEKNPLTLNGVLKIVLVCAKFSSKLLHGT